MKHRFLVLPKIEPIHWGKPIKLFKVLPIINLGKRKNYEIG